MKPMIRIALLGLVLVIASTVPAQAGVWGTNDIVPAATLVVPFFETGVNVSTHPHDTLLTVYARSSSRIRYQVWNIDGERVFKAGLENVVLGVAETWNLAMRDWISGLSMSEKEKLRVGNFYRGFVTIDHIASETGNSPFASTYPWSYGNTLTGNIYYTRLSEGSSNGLPMIHIEAVEPGTHGALSGFYAKDNRGQTDDRREEIDDDARVCAAERSHGDACVAAADDDMDIRARVFNVGALNGETRFIVFAWNTLAPDSGGPSVYCDTNPSCDSTYTFRWYTSDGSVQQSSTRRLDHVVNIIPITGASESGELLFLNLPNPQGTTQYYAFTFNSAKPAGGANLNWDAIFEANFNAGPASP